MKNTLVIDRIEDGWAVIEYGQTGIAFNMPKALLPEGAGEGDIIELCISIEKEDTRRRRQKLEKLLDENMED